MVDNVLYGFTALVVLDRTTDYRDLTIYGYVIAKSEEEAHEKVTKNLGETFHSIESVAVELSLTDVVII